MMMNFSIILIMVIATIIDFLVSNKIQNLLAFKVKIQLFKLTRVLLVFTCYLNKYCCYFYYQDYFR